MPDDLHPRDADALIRDPRGGVARLVAIMARLRDRETGCPWDIEQDFDSIAPYTIEEAYEVADAIARKDMAGLRDELGDLLFQVVYHARMAEEQGAFAFGDVARAIADKMVRRHPHVFGAESRDKPPTSRPSTGSASRPPSAAGGRRGGPRRRRRRPAGAHPRGEAPEPRRPRRLRLAGRRRRCSPRSPRRPPSSSRPATPATRRGRARSTATSCS